MEGVKPMNTEKKEFGYRDELKRIVHFGTSFRLSRIKTKARKTKWSKFSFTTVWLSIETLREEFKLETNENFEFEDRVNKNS